MNPSVVRRSILLVWMGCLFWAAGARADDIPIAGRSVPQLSLIDQAVLDVMQDGDVGAGVVAVMRNGTPIYHRAFGWQDAARTEPLPINTMMRLASVTKPLTAAAIRSLVQPGVFSLSDQVFDITGQGNGILPHQPFGTGVDARLNDITPLDLLRHRGGWDRGIAGDHTYRERQIASDMGIANPPGRDATLEWILGQPLQFDPGADYAYSNIGYMTLGMISEQLSGQPHIDVIRERVLEPISVEPTLVVHGRTFAEDQDPREPFYDHAGSYSFNVYYPDESAVQVVPRPYGGFDVDARIGQGGVVASPLAILEFLDNYQIAGTNIGAPRLGPGNWRLTHSGGYTGTSTYATQRGDGINFVILFNKASTAGALNSALNDIFDDRQISQWPTADVTLPPMNPPGDFNFDNIVDLADYVVWRNHLGAYVEPWTSGDATGDGLVTHYDYEVWKQHFGQQGDPRQVAAAVPEPATLWLMFPLIAVLLWRRRALAVSSPRQ
ncbi:serine hydrolase [Aeoliella sp. ICT_H6.2]|uniref:Serine hydrolase n=1 Tax=Aeoliella straminimaris TaxID=2954799 RepID=A0A9X2JKB2_9BACT|nr:serine hydrolase [Aeoliella straminimaris]MCO6047983.1 serine hydrolase [Aeoliella straminimaris]